MEISDYSIDETWKCILVQYIKKIVTDSKKNPGICVFVMRSEPKKGIFNCQYEYMIQGTPLWDEFMKMSGNKIDDIYDPSKMYLVSVFIPSKDQQTSGNVRAFLYDTHCEVDIQSK